VEQEFSSAAPSQDITGGADVDGFEYSVPISDKGKTIAVGAPWNDGMNGEYSGHVRIFRLDDDGLKWEQIGDDFDGDLYEDQPGYSVSLSVNSTIVVIGAPYVGVNDIRTGEVRVYRIDIAGSSWERLGESIYGDNYGDDFGCSVDISHDSITISMGSTQLDGRGYVQVFSLEGSDHIGAGNWRQIGQNITGEAIGELFRFTVSFSDDGKTIAIVAPGANGMNGGDSGQVWVY
jgi:hypothetical protein